MPAMPPAKAKPLQEMLNKVIGPKPPLDVDGVFGEKTVAVLKEFQKKAGLKESGEVDAETAPVIARVMKTGKIEKDPPEVYVDLGGGKYAGFTQKEWEQAKKKAVDNLMRGPLREMLMKVEAAESEYDFFTELNGDQYVVATFVSLTRGAKMPNYSVISKARSAHAELEKLAKAGDFQGFSRRAPSAAKEVNEALEAMRSYRETMIEGAGNWVTGLEATKWASFTALSVYFAPVMAAQLGAGAVAGAVVGGAAVKGVESAAGEVGNWSAGNAKGQDPGGMISRVVIDTAVGAVTGWLSKGGAGGKAVGEAIMTKISAGIAAKLALQGTSAKVLEVATKYFLNEGGKKVLEGAVADAAKALKGDPKMSVKTFAENIAANFLKGCAFGPFNQAFKKFTEGKQVPMPEGDRKKLQDAIEKKVFKELPDDNIMKQAFDKAMKAKFDKLASDTIAKAISKTFEKAVVGIFETLKGTPNPKAIEDELQAQLITPDVVNECRDVVADEIIKELKKLRKK